MSDDDDKSNDAMMLYIVQYNYLKLCNNTCLAQLVRTGTDFLGRPLGPLTRNFIADVLEGKIKRRRGARKESPHDIEITYIIELLLEGGNNLVSNKKCGPGAAAIVASQFPGVSEEAATKAYYRTIKVFRQMKAICPDFDFDASD